MVKSPAKLVKKCEGRDSLSDILSDMSGLQITPCIKVGRQRTQISSCLPRNLSEKRYLRNRIFSPQKAAQIQSDLTLCDL